MGLAGGLANLVAPSVLVGWVVALIRLPCFDILKHDRFTVVAPHDNLFTAHSGALRHLVESQIASVHIEDVVVSRMAWGVEGAEVGVSQV